MAAMPRACVIVLDAVGAGELPDAAEFGDEGSDTLGNVAKAVGGLDLPTLEALGLGNVEPLDGCPPQPGAPAVAGRLVGRARGHGTTPRSRARRRSQGGSWSGRAARTRPPATGSSWGSSRRRRCRPTRTASPTT